MPESNVQGEPVIDSYSDFIDIHIFFDGNPKVKTIKRLGWVVENNQNLPFLIHCSYHLPELQKDSLFHISGQYTGMSDRVFRVTELTCDIQAPDHLVAQVVPVYENQTVGETETEIAEKYDRSNYYLQQSVDYRGHDYHPIEETK